MKLTGIHCSTKPGASHSQSSLRPFIGGPRSSRGAETRASLRIRQTTLLVLLAVCVGLSPASAQIRIYISTDLDGASGVYQFAQTREVDTPLNLKAREYFMGDLAAVVHGLRDGGATEILVYDGHGTQAFIPDLMVPGAKYATGKPKSATWGLDKTYSGLVMLGFHAMMGTPDGVLHHTQSSKTENRYWYNGVESGELAQVAALAGCYGVPPILVTGDEATCREARKFFGTNCVTLAVKQGISREAAVLYPFEETRRALYEGAKRAVAAIPHCRPYQLTAPIQARKQWLVFGPEGTEPKPVTKEGVIEDPLRLLDF